MKKNFISLFALCAFCAATLVACGSDDDDFGVEADEYGKTAKDLESMECTAKKDGMIVYLSEDNKRMVDGFERAGEQVSLIDSNYEQVIEKVLD